MIYIISKKRDMNPFKLISAKYDSILVDPKPIDWSIFTKKDVIISDEVGITAKAKKRRICTIFVMYANTNMNSQKREADFILFYRDSRRFMQTVILGVGMVRQFAENRQHLPTRRCIRAIVFNEEHTKMLLLKRKYPLWGFEFPGGGIEKGESEIGALEREVYEESGIRSLKVLKRLKDPISYYGIGFSSGIRISLETIFIIEAKETKNISFNDESARAVFISGKWFNPDKGAKKHILWPEQNMFVDVAIAYAHRHRNTKSIV